MGRHLSARSDGHFPAVPLFAGRRCHGTARLGAHARPDAAPGRLIRRLPREMSEFARSIHATADRVAGQRGGEFSIRLILKPRGAAAGSQNYPFSFSGAPFFVLVNMATSCFRRYEGTMRESLDSSTSALKIR